MHSIDVINEIQFAIRFDQSQRLEWELHPSTVETVLDVGLA